MRALRGREIGAIFQDPLTSLDPLLRVGDQTVETIRTHLPMSDRAARARALELLVGIGIPAAETRIDHYPHQFSGSGRRVVIALALCAGPKLIIADEPTTALDVSIEARSSPDCCEAALPRAPNRRAYWSRTRHGGDRRNRRSRCRDVCRPRGRDRPGRRRDPPAAASLFGGPDGVDPERARPCRGAAPDRRRDAAATRCRRAARSIRAVRSAWRAAVAERPARHGRVPRAAACFLAQEASAYASDIILRVEDAACWFDVSPPWLSRVIERRPRRVLKAVDGVSFAVRRGTTFSIVGESGCGKSTLARMVVGLIRRARRAWRSARSRSPRARTSRRAS